MGASLVRNSMLGALLLLGMQAGLYAQIRIPGYPPGEWWKDRAYEELRLSADQKAKLESMWRENRKALIDQKAEFDKFSFDLSDIVARDQVDEFAAIKAFEQTQLAQMALQRTTFVIKLRIKNGLSPEQEQKLEETWDRIRRAREAGRITSPPRSFTGPPGKWWKDHAYEELRLSADQQEKLESIWVESRKRLNSEKAEFDKLNSDLSGIMSRDYVDEFSGIRAFENALFALMALQRTNFAMRTRIKNILSPEQQQKLEETWDRLRRERGVKPPSPGNPNDARLTPVPKTGTQPHTVAIPGASRGRTHKLQQAARPLVSPANL